MCKEMDRTSKENVTRDFYKAVKNITRRFSPRLEVVKDDSNNVVTDSFDALNRWKEYCEKLYKNQNYENKCPIETQSMIHEPPPLFAKWKKH